jgi:ketosteroid isomerase-like protein
MPQQQSISVETVKAILDAFNAHDLDAIMEFFADDCSLDMPRGQIRGGSVLWARRP